MMQVRQTANSKVSQAGFSLVEVLVALSVIALLGAVMAGALLQFGRMQAITQAVASEQELDAALQHIAELVKRQVELPLIDQDERKMAITGTGQSLRLVSAVRVASDLSVAREVDLSNGEEDGLPTIIERHFARRALGAKPEGSFAITPGPATIRFRYLGQGTGATGSRWAEIWSEGSRPLAIAVDITLIRGKKPVSGNRIVVLQRD